MKITIEKCETCGAVFEDETEFIKHQQIHQTISEIEKTFNLVTEDDGCVFANGGYFVQRSSLWLHEYQKLIEKLVAIYSPNNYVPWSYGWFRSLDDGNSMFYKYACIANNVCPKCYKEYGQQYYTINCECGE